MNTPPQFSRRNFLHGLTGLAGASVLAGCAGNHFIDFPMLSPSAATQKNPQPVPAGALTIAGLSVSKNIAGTIGNAFAGLAYEKLTLTEPLFTSSNANLIGLFKRLGTSILRIGGNSVDNHVWTPNGAGRTSGQIAPSDVASLAAFVKATGWQIVYGINLAGAANGTTSPQLAAEEVACAVQQFGSSLLGIEIGNECDEYGSIGSYFAGNWTLDQFVTLWSQYRAAILQVTPTAPIVGPASGTHVATWTAPFGETVGSSGISLLTQHYYKGNGQAAGLIPEDLLAPDPTLQQDLATLRAASQKSGLPFRLAECNSYYNGGAFGISNSYASSLWSVDYLFTLAAGGASGANFQGGDDTAGYTPIADNKGVVVEARPVFYGLLMFTLAGQGTLYETILMPETQNVTAYAVRSASGGWNIVIVNKSATENLQMTVDLPTQVNSATLLQMTQQSAGANNPNLSATDGITIQGAAIDIDGGFAPKAGYTLTTSGNEIACYVPALTAVLIQVN